MAARDFSAAAAYQPWSSIACQRFNPGGWQAYEQRTPIRRSQAPPSTSTVGGELRRSSMRRCDCRTEASLPVCKYLAADRASTAPHHVGLPSCSRAACRFARGQRSSEDGRTCRAESEVFFAASRSSDSGRINICFGPSVLYARADIRVLTNGPSLVAYALEYAAFVQPLVIFLIAGTLGRVYESDVSAEDR